MTNYHPDHAAIAPMLRTETWLVRVATHLLVLLPQLSALEAARAAIDLYEEKQGLEPQVAVALLSLITDLDALGKGFGQVA